MARGEQKARRPMKTTSLPLALLLAALACLPARAAGLLTPIDAGASPLATRVHQVAVTINNGFAQTEVLQSFFNPSPHDLEAIYSFPLPPGASLAEVTVITGEKTLQGEVVATPDAERIYGEERKTNDAGLAKKNGFRTFEFRVAPVRAASEVQLRFVYYQPLAIDAGVGRYVYPLEDGGTDDRAQQFWTTRTQVDGNFSIAVELKSAAPIADVRAPGFEAAAAVQKIDDGHFRLTLDRTGTKLDRDFVFYYRLADNLPGRIEVIPYRAAKDKPGTFMMVVTPGEDLRPLTRGADYTYVLDVSGSMQAKLRTLANGVAQALGEMRPEDRFRVITFNDRGREIVPWTQATPENARQAISLVKSLTSSGGTNIYEGLSLAFRDLDADRATSVVLVTDGVTNVGIVDPAAFRSLVERYDVRIFCFLMGNSANWPLVRTIADASGGFYAGVSNDDDILGQLLRAKGKITHEALHGAALKFSGPVRVTERTSDAPRKIYRGEQLVIFGRYDRAGPATVTLDATLTGENKRYTTTFDFPETDTDNPEIERLWALATIGEIEAKENAGLLPATDAHAAIRSLGVAFQIVTDHTSMLVLDDATHARHGIARANAQRTSAERAAQSVRAAQPARPAQVDVAQPAFKAPAAHVGRYRSGGGDLSGDTVFLLVMLGLVIVGVCTGRCHGPKHHE